MENRRALIIAVIVGFVTLVGYPTLASKIRNDVMKDLKSNYTPGPYSPGFNPDKVDASHFIKTSQEVKIVEDFSTKFDNERMR